ncbi:MAG: DNA-formamidopyrimidine glycosylase family protein [Dermatophilaceae bacterium]
MPELPEVQALVDLLRERTGGQTIGGIELGSISVLKTYDPAPTSLYGLPISTVTRHGTFIDLEAEGLHLVFHLARAC